MTLFGEIYNLVQMHHHRFNSTTYSVLDYFVTYLCHQIS